MSRSFSMGEKDKLSGKWIPSGIKNFFFTLSEITSCFSLGENDLAEEEKLLMQEEKPKVCRIRVLIR